MAACSPASRARPKSPIASRGSLHEDRRHQSHHRRRPAGSALAACLRCPLGAVRAHHRRGGDGRGHFGLGRAGRGRRKRRGRRQGPVALSLRPRSAPARAIALEDHESGRQPLQFSHAGACRHRDGLHGCGRQGAGDQGLRPDRRGATGIGAVRQLSVLSLCQPGKRVRRRVRCRRDRGRGQAAEAAPRLQVAQAQGRRVRARARRGGVLRAGGGLSRRPVPARPQQRVVSGGIDPGRQPDRPYPQRLFRGSVFRPRRHAAPARPHLHPDGDQYGGGQFRAARRLHQA